MIIGENTKSSIRCITIDAIKNGLLRGNFIGTFTKTGVKELGSYDAADFQTTFDALTPFLEAAFDYLREGLDTQWKLGNAEGGFVFINNGVEAFLRLLSDVVDHVVEHDNLNPLTATPEEMMKACCFFIDPLIEHLSGLSAEEGLAYRKQYGSGAGMRYYRRLQQAVHEARAEFNPGDLEEWLKAEDKKFVNVAREIVGDLETFFKTDVKERLQAEYGKDWERLGLPRKIRTESGHRAVEENAKDDLVPGHEVTPWDMMYLIDYREIMIQNEQLWVAQFKKRYTMPGAEEKSGGRKGQTSWIVQLNDIRNKAAHARGVITEEEFAFLQELKSWLLLGEVDNEL